MKPLWSEVVVFVLAAFLVAGCQTSPTAVPETPTLYISPTAVPETPTLYISPTATPGPPTHYTKPAKDYVLSAEEIGEGLEVMNEDESLDWRPTEFAPKISLSPEGLRSAYFRDVRNLESGINERRVRQHIAVYETPEHATAAFRDLQPQLERFMREHVDAAECQVPFGDASWGMNAAGVPAMGERQLHCSIVQYANTVVHLHVFARSVPQEDIEKYSRLGRDKLIEAEG